MQAEKGDSVKFVKPGRLLAGAISWHLVQSYISKNRVLVIELEQRIKNGAVQSVTVTDQDYVISRRPGQSREHLLYGVFACERCEHLVDQMELSDEYESVSIRTKYVDEDTGKVSSNGLVHWSESHCELRVRHNNKLHRFGLSSHELAALEAA